MRDGLGPARGQAFRCPDSLSHETILADFPLLPTPALALSRIYPRPSQSQYHPESPTKSDVIVNHISVAESCASPSRGFVLMVRSMR